MAFNDLYARVGSLSGLGNLFAEIVVTYKSVMKRSAQPPAYVADLMGNYTMRSMLLQYPVPGTPPNEVNLSPAPFHVARAINDIHLQLMGMLRNVRYRGQPQQVVEEESQKADVKTMMARYINNSAKVMRGDQSGNETTPQDNSACMRVLGRMIQASRPEALPILSFELEDKKTKKKSEIKIPNVWVDLGGETIEVPWSQHLKSMPLACIAWGLGKATSGNLLTDPAGSIINFMVGTQRGLTTGMEVLLSAIEKEMANKNLDNYLVRDGRALSKTIREEAHHFRMWRAMRTIEQRDTIAIDKLFLAAGVPSVTFSLDRNDKNFARDTACLLYSTAQALSEAYNAISAVPQARVIKQALDAKAGFSSSMRQMMEGLKGMASTVYSLREPQKVITFLQEPHSRDLLSDAMKRSEIIRNSNCFERETDMGLGLRMIQQVTNIQVGPGGTPPAYPGTVRVTRRGDDGQRK